MAGREGVPEGWRSVCHSARWQVPRAAASSRAPLPKKAPAEGTTPSSANPVSRMAPASAGHRRRSAQRAGRSAAIKSAACQPASSSSTGRRVVCRVAPAAAAPPTSRPASPPPRSETASRCSQSAGVPTAPIQRVASAFSTAAAYSAPRGMPARAPTVARIAPSAWMARRTDRSSKPHANSTPASAARRSASRRIVIPARPAAAATRKKLIPRKRCAKLVEPRAASIASCRTGRKQAGASGSRRVARAALLPGQPPARPRRLE